MSNIRVKTLTSGTSGIIQGVNGKLSHTIAVTGTGSATVVPRFIDATADAASFSVADVMNYTAAGVDYFTITAVGGTIEVVVY